MQATFFLNTIILAISRISLNRVKYCTDVFNYQYCPQHYLKGDWFMVYVNNYVRNFVLLLKSLIANVLKCLKSKFKCVCVTIYVFLSDEFLLT